MGRIFRVFLTGEREASGAKCLLHQAKEVCMQGSNNREESQKKRRFSLEEVAELVAKLDTMRPRFKLLKRGQASAHLAARGATNYTPKALANLASRGNGPPYLRLGNEAYYLEHDLDAWILKQRIVPKSFYAGNEVV